MSECESGCLYGESGRLRDGSTGLKTFRRTCREYRYAIAHERKNNKRNRNEFLKIDLRYSRRKCYGPDKKYEACTPKQVCVCVFDRIQSFYSEHLITPRLNFSVTISHASLYPNSAIKFVNERRNSTTTFWSRAYRRSVRIQKNHAKCIVRRNRVYPSPKVGHIQMAQCAEIMDRIVTIVIFA